MKLELLKNKKDFNCWLAIAKYSNYAESELEENILIEDEFKNEMVQSFKFTKKLKNNFKISFGLPILLAFKENNNIIGTVSIRKDAHKAYACQINNIAIHPNYRRQGLGRLMIEELVNLVRTHSNYYHITLTTDASRGFYQKIGMRLAGVLNFGNHTRYFFEKTIRE